MKNTIKNPGNSNKYSNATTDVLPLGADHLKYVLALSTKSQLNKVIVGRNNSPDHLAINIYWDTLRSWYTPQKIYTKDGNILHIKKLKTKGVYLDYAKLSKTHGVSKEMIRQKIVKLEGLGLVNRSFKHSETTTTRSFNQLIVYVWQQTPHFFNSCGIDRDEVRELIPYTNHKYISEKYNIYFKPNGLQIKAFKDMGVSNQLRDTKELNKPFSKEKDRSMKSNFLQNSFFKKEQSNLGIRYRHSSSTLQLKDFYPLSPEDAKSLQIHSGREFSLNAMNEILLDMATRVRDRWFKSKKGFLSYMSIVFKHEMRDACEVSNEGFKIKANQTVEEKTIRKQEEFLSQIEYSPQVSPEWHLKKKLCSVLEREKAYNLLSSCKYCRLNGDTFEIHLTKQIELTSLEQDIILNQVKATHESFDLATGNFMSISSLKLVSPAQLPKAVEQGVISPSGIWGSVRQALISYFGKEGDALDRAWFSKLTSEVDETAKRIKLKAPSEFIKDWVNRNYAQVLESCSREHQYSCEIC